jgi:hypothetical protein
VTREKCGTGGESNVRCGAVRFPQEPETRAGRPAEHRETLRRPQRRQAWREGERELERPPWRLVLVAGLVLAPKAVTKRSVILGACALAFGVSASADARIPSLWQNCKHVNARYLHGVGKLKAHDATTGDPVTNFKRSTRLYLLAMRYNRGLDRDKDGIACEKL